MILDPQWVTKVRSIFISVKQRAHLIAVQGKPWVHAGVCDWDRFKEKKELCTVMAVGENS